MNGGFYGRAPFSLPEAWSFLLLPVALALSGAWVWAASGPVSSPYWVLQQTFAAKDHRYPRLNNHGEFVWIEQVGGQRQVFSNTRGQLTSVNADWTDAVSPAIADDGSYITLRHKTDPYFPSAIVKYPRALVIVQTHANADSADGNYQYVGDHVSMSSDGRVIYPLTTESCTELRRKVEPRSIFPAQHIQCYVANNITLTVVVFCAAAFCAFRTRVTTSGNDAAELPRVHEWRRAFRRSNNGRCLSGSQFSVTSKRNPSPSRLQRVDLRPAHPLQLNSPT